MTRRSLAAVLTLICAPWLAAADNSPTERAAGGISGGTVVPQIAVGGAWETEFQVTNLENTPQSYTLSFHNSDGSPLPIQLLNLAGMSMGTHSVYTVAIQPGATQFWRAPGESTVVAGYAALATMEAEAVAVQAVLTQRVDERPPFQASVPGLQIAQDLVRVPFRNDGAFTTTAAYVSQAQQTATLRALDENGVELCRLGLGLASSQHGAFILRDLLPCVNGRNGTFEVATDSAGLTMIAFLFHDAGPFTTQVPYDVLTGE